MISDKIKNIISEQLNIDKKKILDTSNLEKDFHADSLDYIELIMAIEDEFDIEIPDSKISDFKTVKELIEYIENN